MHQRKEPKVVILLVTLGCLRTVAAASVSEACNAQPCFSGVVGACGSCLPTSADAFCEPPCQPSWGGADVITCLGQAGDSYWLQTIQSLNQKCGLPPIPKSADDTELSGGLSPEVTPATAAPVSQPVIRSGGSQSLSGQGVDPRAAGKAAEAAGKARGAKVAAEAEAQAAATRAEAARQKALGGDLSGYPDPASASAGGATGLVPGGPVAVSGGGTGGTAAVSGSPVSSAIAAFGCAINSGNLSIEASSACVLFITNDNDCPADCASQFNKVAPLCRNTMAQENFYGALWRGIFEACRISFSMTGQTLLPTPAELATTPAVASAASSAQRIAPRQKPLLAAANLLESQSGAMIMVSKLLSVFLLTATLLLTL